MRNKFSVIGVLVLFVLTVAPVLQPAVFARAAYAATVSNIVITGNQRVENETVLSYMQLGPGDVIDDQKIDESIKVLFQTGLFKDVRIDRRGNQLVVSVVENPLINVVNFEGNDAIGDDELAKEVQVRERMIFTKARVASDNRRILELYHKQGYYNVEVQPKLIRMPENRVNLVFEINEGGKTSVQHITFEGNTSFSSYRLRHVISTKKKVPLLFFLRNTTYDADRLEFDKELLRRFYLKNGYADVQIESADAQLMDDGFAINFRINEGPRYHIADVAVNIGDNNLDGDKLRSVVKTGVGDRFNAEKVNITAEKLTLEAAKEGFVFAKVDPVVKADPASSTLTVTYDITEGPRVYVERIDIVGNTRTHDDVIRRELELYEGDAYNKALVERAKRNLIKLDFFATVDFREEPGSAADKIVLVVQVQEKSTGQLTFSLGYSSVEKVIGSIGVSERNLFGTGKEASLNTSLSFKKQSVDFSFTEPYFMGMPIAAGIDLFGNSSDNSNYSSYTSRQIGGALRAGFKLDDYSRIDLRYMLAFRDVVDVDEDHSSPAIISQLGKTWKSSVTAKYTYDDLDSPISPTTGLRAQLEAEIAGLGGDAQFAKVQAHAWYFTPLPIMDDRVVMKFEGNAGYIQPFKKDVPLQDRFFMGGDTFRGFDYSGVGPHQYANDDTLDAIGGKAYAIGTVEANFPLGLPEEYGIEGAVFSDFGTVFGAVDKSVPKGAGNCSFGSGIKDCDVIDELGLRASVGAGIIWNSPFGPLKLSASYPVLKQKGDVTQTFLFSMGTRF
ncbi:MAG: outer membrane protein assembly factor BamA [Hyphomicrobiales bacterium]